MPSRYLSLLIASGVCLTGLFFVLAYGGSVWLWLVVGVAALLTLVGLRDLTQVRHSILRNYPILAHFRFLFEYVRPEIRQYFIESDTEAAPFSRAARSLAYQRAKRDSDKRPFGTQRDLYVSGYEWINHSLVPAPVADSDFRVLIGAASGQPYNASVFNISAMSFGSLSANAILALNEGARRGGFAHDTGEGSISRYHRAPGGDLIWEIGSGYFGCRTADGGFDPVRFGEQASERQVKMVKLKLSQGAKPGHGGVLPAAKVTPEIAETRGVPLGVDCISPARHCTFSTPTELLEFIARLRELSGNKPTGFKLAIGHPWEFFAIAKAMVKTGITPDFIVVDGAEGGTGAAPVEFTDQRCPASIDNKTPTFTHGAARGRTVNAQQTLTEAACKGASYCSHIIKNNLICRVCEGCICGTRVNGFRRTSAPRSSHSPAPRQGKYLRPRNLCRRTVRASG